MTTQKDLVEIVATFPIIDSHAHPLLTNQKWYTYPIEAAFTEAANPALQDSTHTLAFKKGIQKLTKLSSKLYGPEISSPSSQLESLKTQRAHHSFEECCETCFKAPNVNIQCILFDDGLYGDYQSLESHVGLVEEVRRVVRIERVAEEILESLFFDENKNDHKSENEYLSRFEPLLQEKLVKLAKDDNVVAFKSIAAYRTGLNINTNKEENSKIEHALIEILKKARQHNNKSQTAQPQQSVRIDEKAVIDLVVNIGIKISSDFKKPIQFHTGFGDNDLNLLHSNPLYLRALIEENPDAKIILLHASYPFTRQAGYLATVYNNVFVDIGMIFPQISHYAQIQTLHEVISLTPTNKILFSTDGHHVPEVFYCAVVEARETLTKVLMEVIENGDLNIEEAIEIAKKILFFNANLVYNLSLTPKSVETATSSLDAEVNPIHAIKMIRNFRAKFVRVDWLDISNIHRHHVIPIERFEESTINSGVSAATVVQCLPYYGDEIVKNSLTATGEVLLKPDLKTLKPTVFPTQIRVQSFIVEKITGSPSELCPRLMLKRIVDNAYKEFGVKFLVGIESEFCVISKNDDGSFKSIDDSVYAASSALRCNSWISPALEEIAESLLKQDIVVEQFHPEASKGQYEMVTGPAPPLESIDNLVATRQTIYDVMAKYGHHATFLPKLYPDQAGNGAHLHLSLTTENQNSPNNDKLSKYEQSFIAGTLRHLRALCALTLPTTNSYKRLVVGCWAGSTYVSYGFENRESQIRICYRGGSYNFEHRFATAALIAAGVAGIKEGLDLSKIKAVECDPATLSDQERHAYGITERLPCSLREALDAFKKDNILQDALGKEFSRVYLCVKEAELTFAESLHSDDLLNILVSRY
ncbi:9146_t:CDS:10 [Ambispora gerdemannii]|uniref:Glutamine synthetase n=1 Tax=Ambispora gerdemannii TaxID=144530 RepID=A0A9N8V2R0_9GLOM|nr:9146_t:CDS:10 [Ambispora gerdemannii]